MGLTCSPKNCAKIGYDLSGSGAAWLALDRRARFLADITPALMDLQLARRVGYNLNDCPGIHISAKRVSFRARESALPLAMRIKSPRAPLHRRLLRPVCVCLLLLQIHLLSVAELHRHQPAEFSSDSSAIVREGNQPQPPLSNGLLCTACQIIRHGSARPATGSPVPGPAALFPLRFVFRLGLLNSHAAASAYGRAPPHQ